MTDFVSRRIRFNNTLKLVPGCVGVSSVVEESDLTIHSNKVDQYDCEILVVGESDLAIHSNKSLVVVDSKR